VNSRRVLASLLTGVLAVAALPAAASLAQDDGAIELTPVESTLLKLRTVVPAEWEDLGSGAYRRGDSDEDQAALVTQPAPLPMEQLWPTLLQQLGLSEIPEAAESRSTGSLDWSIYQVDIPLPPTSVRLGIAEIPGTTYIVILTSAPDEHETLVEQVFDPAIASLEPLERDPAGASTENAYASEDVSFPGGQDGVELAGTLTIPPGEGPHPAMVLMNGSGAQDRDSSFRPVTELDPFAKLADALTSAGIAVLRYDDRGTGESTGDYPDATIEDLAADGGAAVDLLVSRPDVDPEQIGVLGHSEGTIYAGMLAADDPRVAFAVAMAPPAVDGQSVILEQQAAILRSMDIDEEDITEAVEVNRLVFSQIDEGDAGALEATIREVIGERWDELTEEQQTQAGERAAFVDKYTASTMPALRSDYIRSFIRIDPSSDWSRVTVPTLGLFAGKDIQVLLDQNEPSFRAALEEAGNDDFESVIFADANHLFQAAETGYLDEYAKLAPEFTPDFAPTLVDWVIDHVEVAG